MHPAAPLVSGEGVALHLDRASAGSRIAATVVDLVVQGAGALLLLVVTALIAGGSDAAAVQAVLIVEVVLVVVGYPLLFEWLGRGRTLGKLWLGLRVVRDDGGPITLRQALVRALAGAILEKPGLLGPVTGGVGLLVLLLNRNDKRIGDLLAGTVVVNERGGPRTGLLVGELAPPPHLWPWAATLDLSRLDDGLALALRQFLARAGSMAPAARDGLAEQLRARIAAVTAPPPPPGTPTPWFLVTVAAERRRRSAAH
ncbi:MAG: RDD family protein [Jatrophihabitans sp.]|uniref:RDD family protein n=1 Tax=Jatrophihabitans sp. TaxID=1932789 RepID=UPI003F819CCB